MGVRVFPNGTNALQNHVSHVNSSELRLPWARVKAKNNTICKNELWHWVWFHFFLEMFERISHFARPSFFQWDLRMNVRNKRSINIKATACHYKATIKPLSHPRFISFQKDHWQRNVHSAGQSFVDLGVCLAWLLKHIRVPWEIAVKVLLISWSIC